MLNLNKDFMMELTDIPMEIPEKEKIRNKIAKATERDPLSHIGNHADMLGLLTAIKLADTVALSEADDFANFKAAKMAILEDVLDGEDVIAMAKEKIEKIKHGDVILTASLKGIEGVLDDTLGDSTKVATVLMQQSETNA